MKVWENIWETPFERKGTCIQIIFIIFHVLYAFWLQLFLADHPKKTNTLLSWEQIVALSRFQKKKILDQFFIHPQIVELRPCLLLSVMKRCTCIIWGILANQVRGSLNLQRLQLAQCVDLALLTHSPGWHLQCWHSSLSKPNCMQCVWKSCPFKK